MVERWECLGSLFLCLWALPSCVAIMAVMGWTGLEDGHSCEMDDVFLFLFSFSSCSPFSTTLGRGFWTRVMMFSDTILHNSFSLPLRIADSSPWLFPPLLLPFFFFHFDGSSR